MRFDVGCTQPFGDRAPFAWFSCRFLTYFCCRASEHTTRASIPLGQCKTWQRYVVYANNNGRRGRVLFVSWTYNRPWTVEELAEPGIGVWFLGRLVPRVRWSQKCLFRWRWLHTTGHWEFGVPN